MARLTSAPQGPTAGHTGAFGHQQLELQGLDLVHDTLDILGYLGISWDGLINLGYLGMIMDILGYLGRYMYIYIYMYEYIDCTDELGTDGL